MSPGSNDETGRRRRATTANDHEDCCGWHDRLVEHFGADARGGEWSRVVKVIEKHDALLEDWKAFRWKLLGMTTLGGIVAGVLAWLIPYLAKH